MNNKHIALLVIGVLVLTAGQGTGQVAPIGAELVIQQPHYVDSEVTRESHDGIPLYGVRGSVQYLRPVNFNQSSVIDYGVLTEAGSLSYNDRLGLYEFRPESQSGTFEVYWTTETQRIVNNTSVTATTRYEAVIRANDTTIQAVPPSQISSLEGDAENWSSFRDQVLSERIAGQDADIETQTQLALDLLTLRHHPLSALTGDLFGLLVAIVLSLSGLVLLTIFFTYHYLSRRGDIKTIHRRESLEAGEETVIERVNALQEQERFSALENMDWHDIYPNDQIAYQMKRALGENPFVGLLSHFEVIGNLKYDRLHAMGLAGHHARITDYGTGEAIERAEVLPPDTSPGDHAEYDTTDPDIVSLQDPSEELVLAVPWDDQYVEAFDLAGFDVDSEKLETEFTGPTLDEIIERLDVMIPRDFDTKQEFGRYYLEFIESVRNHDHTDQDGFVRPVRHHLNQLLRLDRVMGDKYNIPLAVWSAEFIEMLLLNADLESEIEEYVNRVQEGKET